MSDITTPARTAPDGYLRTLVRRETTRSRSVAVSVALGILALAAAYAATECVLAALGRPALLVAPDDALAAIVLAQPWTVAAVIGLALLGIVALVAALTPGRRARHELTRDRVAVLVDDDILAGAISRRAAVVGAVSRDQVRTAVSSRAADVSLRPSSGFPIDHTAVSAAASALVAELAPVRTLRTRVQVDENGMVAR